MIAPPQNVLQGSPQQAPPAPQQPALPQQVPSAQLNSPPPQAPPNPKQIKRSVATNKLILSELSGIINDPSVLQNPDKLQKALLNLTADSRRIAGDDAGPVGTSLAHVMDIMNDPRGPKDAIRDRMSVVLNKIGQLDNYSRQQHGGPAVLPSNQEPTVEGQQ